MKIFEISFVGSTIEDRPHISYLVREYFEKFILNNVILDNGIDLKEWNICLAIFFIERGRLASHNEPFFFPNKCTLLRQERIKLYEALIYTNNYRNNIESYVLFLNYIYDVLKLLVFSLSKKITMELIEEMRKLIDFEYLQSLPFPAPYEEQRYVEDKTVPSNFYDDNIKSG